MARMTKKSLKIIIKWLLLLLPWAVAIGLYVYSFNRGGGISGWAASFVISIVITWAWCFMLYKSEPGGELESILNIALGVVDILIALLGLAALIGEVIPFAVATAAHLIVFGVFKAVRASLHEGRAAVGGIAIAYFAVGGILTLISLSALML